MSLPSARRFYENQYQGETYGADQDAGEQANELHRFIWDYDLKEREVLEIGFGRGSFQDLVKDWVGVELAVSASRFAHRPFVVASADHLPFKDACFDGIWSISVLEHVPRVEQALREVARVLKPGGVALLAPAWHCRSWAAQGYAFRAWSELDFKDRLVKVSIPLRECLWFRAACTIPVRIWRELVYTTRKRPFSLHYRKLKANYTTFWCADSDACNSLDISEMLLWFRARGWDTPSHPTLLRRLLARHGSIWVRKPLTKTL